MMTNELIKHKCSNNLHAFHDLCLALLYAYFNEKKTNLDMCLNILIIFFVSLLTSEIRIKQSRHIAILEAGTNKQCEFEWFKMPHILYVRWWHIYNIWMNFWRKVRYTLSVSKDYKSSLQLHAWILAIFICALHYSYFYR